MSFCIEGNDVFDGTSEDITVLADWQPKLSATDETAEIVTPFIGGDATITPGDAITTGGGDNSTLGGITRVDGTNPSSVSFRFDGLSAKQEKAFKELNCRTDLTVKFFNEDANMVVRDASGLNDGSAGYGGFKVRTYHFGGRSNQGFGTKDSFVMTFQLDDNWSEDMAIVAPSDFNPLTDLVNVVAP